MKKLSLCCMVLLLLADIYSFSQDIIVSSVFYDTNQIQYQQFSCEITLKNTGADTIDQFNVTNIYFSKDSILDSYDENGGFINFTYLNPGDSISKLVIGKFNQFGINVDSSYKYIIVNADYRKEVSEENENNNIWVGRIKIKNTRVDLSVDTYNLNPPDTISQGDLLNINITLKNEGNYQIHNIWYHYFLSNDSVLNSSDIPIGYSNWMGFYWNSTGFSSDELAIPQLEPSDYFLIIEIDTIGQELNISDSNIANNTAVLSKIYIKEDQINSTLNFDQDFGTNLWIEDGYTWSWDKSGWDNIRNYYPYKGSGHATTVPNYTSKLIFPKPSIVKGVWLNIDYGFNVKYLKVLGYNAFMECLYVDTLDHMLYDFSYQYISLNWEEVKYFEFDFDIDDEMLMGNLNYDDLDYKVILDSISPSIECINKQIVCMNSELPDYRKVVNVVDNFKTIKVEQIPAPGIIITEALTVTIKAYDGSNNVDSCSFNVIVHQSSIASITETVCNSYNSPSGKVWTVSDTYIDTIPNAAGCDSIITFNLTINHSSYSTISISACNSYTSPSGKIWTVSDSYIDTIPNAAGCDSIITFNLTVNRSSYSIISINACNNYTSPSGKIWTVSDTYMDTIPNAAGCDSIITINLTVNNSNTSDTVATACDSFEWYGTTYTKTCMPSLIFSNQWGCDSIVTLHLTINNKNFGDTTAFACNQFDWYGISYNTSSNPTHVFTNSIGCDSVVTLHLTLKTIDTSVFQNQTLLIAHENGAKYQWINCKDKSPIPNEIYQSFEASQNGSFAVMVSKDNCSVISNCIDIETINSNDFSIKNLKLYPNPVSNIFTLDFGKEYKNLNIRITDLNGEEVYNKNCYVQEKMQIQLNEPQGIYILTVTADSMIASIKIVKL